MYSYYFSGVFKPILSLESKLGSSTSFFTISAIEKDGEQYLVKTTDGQTITSDYVIDSSGRRPNLSRLGLDATDIQTDKNGIIVNDHLETSVKEIYALGDIVSRKEPKLAPVGTYEAHYLFNLLENKVEQLIHYPVIGTGVFTFPQIAQVGITQNIPKNYETKTLNFQDGIRGGQNDLENQLKLVFDENDQLVGATEISDNAIDDINYYVPIVGMKLKKKDIQNKFISIFPTMGGKVVNVIK